MLRVEIQHKDRASWLDDRKKYITSTRVAALLGCGVGVQTPLQLFHAMKNPDDVDLSGIDRVRWGNYLEEAIAKGAAQEFGLGIEPFKTFVALPEHKIAASFDFKIVSAASEHPVAKCFEKHGVGIMEVKNVDYVQFQKNWLVDGAVEAPANYEAQLQAQLLVSGLKWGVIVALVGGNALHYVLFEANEALHQVMLQKAAWFWELFDVGTPPEADYSKDLDAIGLSNPVDGVSFVDKSDDPHFLMLLESYQRKRDEAARLEDESNRDKAEIIDLLGVHSNALAGEFKIVRKVVAGSTSVVTRKPSVRVTITRKKS